VSVPTVSKVLNGRSDVASVTRERVVEALNSLGYAHRAPAAAATRGGVIDLLIGGIGTLWSVEILRGAEEAAARAGRSLVVTNAVGPGFAMSRWLEALVQHRSLGAVVVTSRATQRDFARLDGLEVPVVQLDPGGGAGGGHARIGATDWAGGRDAARHLVELGHRRIGFIGGPSDLTISRDRHEGYAAALRHAGIELDPELVRHGEFMPASGTELAHALLSLEEPPTALFAASDLSAMGVYHAAQARGLTVPGDLSVVGFDDTFVCEHLSPPLTTVRQPLAEMAAQAVRELERTSGGGRPRIELATTLVVRGSTAPPPHASAGRAAPGRPAPGGSETAP